MVSSLGADIYQPCFVVGGVFVVVFLVGWFAVLRCCVAVSLCANTTLNEPGTCMHRPPSKVKTLSG